MDHQPHIPVGLPVGPAQAEPRGFRTRFAPGQSGNPMGAKVTNLAMNRKLARALARALRPEALLHLRDVLADPRAPSAARAFAGAVIAEAAK